jgi:hypothetical protein
MLNRVGTDRIAVASTIAALAPEDRTAGVLIATSDGGHIMVMRDEATAVEADPVLGHVVSFNIFETKNIWTTQKVVALRFAQPYFL